MLRVRLLGPMEVERDGETVAPAASRRAWGLLAWLALHPGEHARGHVAAQFWPDVLDSSARASLRSAVWALRRALGPDGEIVVAGRDRLGLDAGPGLWVDVQAFDAQVRDGRLAEAAGLVRGDLLAGFEDEWALRARDEFRDRLAGVLDRLADEADANGDADAAIVWARRRTTLDALDEAAHRDLMSRLAAAGDRAGALAVHGRLRERLGRELGVAPAPATRELAERLRHAEPSGAGGDAEPLAAGARALPLIGRERELHDLSDCWAAAREGAGAVVTLTGEPGIGKTRLATELLARAHAEGARVASCAALDLGGAAPLGLWSELIRELSRDLPAPPLDAAWPADLSSLAPDVERRFGREPTQRASAAPDLERARLFEAVVELVEWAAAGRPLVLLMEDLHIADAQSLELTGYVARRIRRLPVLMVLTRRPLPERAEADALEHALRARGVLAQELALGGLADDALAALVRSVAPLDAGDVDQVVAASDGNALLAVERARAVGRGEREPPASLRGAVRVALGTLAADPRLAAEFAAVAGRGLSGEEVRGLPVQRPAAAATEALQTGLLTGRGSGLGYRHALLRDAAYADLAEPHRAWLHETLATTLVERDDPGLAAEIARHLRLAGRDDLAAGQLAQAARHARSLGALEEAAGFLDEALEIAGEDPELLLELAGVEAWRVRAAASDAAFERAVAALGDDPRARAAALVERAYWYAGALCHPGRSLATAREAIETLDDAGIVAPHLKAKALATWAWAEAVTGDPEVTDELLRQVHETVGPQPGDDLLTHSVGTARAHALVRRGRFEESYSPHVAAAQAAQRAARPDLAGGSWLNAACAAACARQFERALEFIERMQVAMRTTELGWNTVQALAAQAHVLVRLGRLDEARAAVAEEAEIADRVDNAELRATAEHDEGMVALALGERQRAERLLGAALEHGAPVSRPIARLARADALVRLGRPEEAERELRETALEPVRPGDMPETLVPRLTRVQGLVASARGDHALAERRLAEAAEGWRRLLDRSGEGDRYMATFVDLARPPVLGLVEPDRELARVEGELRELQTTTV